MKSYNKFVQYCAKIGKKPSRVALDSGVSKTIISRWKAGLSKPTDSTMAKITSYLGVPMDAFKDDAEKKEVPAPLSEGGVFWAERLSRLTASDQALLGTIADRLQEAPEATRAGIGLLLAAVQSVPQGQ